MEVRRVNNNTFDVFIGKQWSDWIRVRKGRSSVHRLAGQHVPHATLKELDELIQINMPITYGQTQQQTLDNCRAM